MLGNKLSALNHLWCETENRWFLFLQEKRKMASAPNGSAHSYDTMKASEHHSGPELQRTGRCVHIWFLNWNDELLKCWFCSLLPANRANTAAETNSLLCGVRIFGGLVNDVRRKTPFLWSDIRDSLSLQCLASILFLYCACMSPVITFGGLLGEATKGNIVRTTVINIYVGTEVHTVRNWNLLLPSQFIWNNCDKQYYWCFKTFVCVHVFSCS